MKVYHFEVNEEDSALLGGQGKLFGDKLDIELAAKNSDAETVTVFVNSILDAAVIDALPNLKLIVTRSTGFDHIDVKYAQSKGIAVSYIPSYGSRTVAEFTFALILSLSRKTVLANFHMRTQENFNYDGFEGFNLQGKTLGIIGTGRIGQEVAKIARGFEMDVLAYDPFPNEEAAEKLGFKYLAMPELLGQSDIVTLHVPYMQETHHLINLENIVQFKKGSILINTSRGEVADTTAILQGLDNNILSAAGLDVLEGEHDLKDEMQLLEKENNIHKEQLKTLLEDHILMQHPQVLITPHMAFYTKEAKAEIARITLENIASFIEGEPKNLIKA
jgi:D-lactate dehydrogenase